MRPICCLPALCLVPVHLVDFPLCWCGYLALPHDPEPDLGKLVKDMIRVDVALLPKDDVPYSFPALLHVEAKAPARFLGPDPASLDIPKVLG
jgi:hypothetical protein